MTEGDGDNEKGDPAFQQDFPSGDELPICEEGERCANDGRCDAELAEHFELALIRERGATKADNTIDT